MAKRIENNGDITWDNWDDGTKAFKGPKVRGFLKGKHEELENKIEQCYSFTPELTKQDDGYYHIMQFASEENYNKWLLDPTENAALLLCDRAIPISDEQGVITTVGLSTESNQTMIVSLDGNVVLRLKFVSRDYNPLDKTYADTMEEGLLTVQARSSSSDSWRTVGSTSIPSVAYETGSYSDVDLTDMLDSGTWQVRVTVVGQASGKTASLYFQSITKTSLVLTLATQWQKPQTSGSLQLQYYATGAVSKTLHVLIDGSKSVSANLGTAVYTETPVTVNTSSISLERGIHTVDAWLSVNNSTTESEHVVSEILIVEEGAEDQAYLLISEAASKLTNWASQKILDYAIYSPTNDGIRLRFVLGNYDGTKEYMDLDMGIPTPGVKYDLTNVVEIDSDDSELTAYMRFYTDGDVELREMIGFIVDNSANFAPTSGSVFILNPRSRTNDESNPQTIINAATGSEVPSTWSGVSFGPDGWTTDDDNNKCLRVLAGSSVEIDYEPWVDFAKSGTKDASLTIELDIAVRNVEDESNPALRMCSYADVTVDGATKTYPLGLEVLPMEACFMTEDNRVRNDQNIRFMENERTHIVLNIIHGINNSSLNLARIFVNSVINREFSWADDDTFVQYVGGALSSQGIRIGSDTADIDVYGIRIYRKALSASDIRQDYLSTMGTATEKQAFRAANDILGDDNCIAYSKVYGVHNTMVITGTMPSYLTGNVKFTTDVDIHMVGDPEHSGTFTGCETSGQGTSSRSYWKWNVQIQKWSNWTDETGVSHGDGGYALDNTVPLAKKLVGKLNWASSQQSHKMGCCNLYTDLWKKVVGGSAITATSGFENCRVTVKQKVVFLFVRATATEEPTFYGVYTFGPGKGDKPTFGYDKDKFPNYLMLEGCDNGTPLTNHRVPWNDDVALDDAGELLMYNGVKQWEVTMGNNSVSNLNRFKDAMNLCYLCNPNIKPHEGTLSALQADTNVDKDSLYWVTSGSGDSAKFDLYRYDSLTDQWVDAGVAKLGSGSYEKLNLSTQTGLSPTSLVWDSVNQSFIDARVELFKASFQSYWNLQDALFHWCFIRLVAASDNRAKNTYWYLDGDSNRTIRFAQDDLDTIFLTDNVGRLRKPYYVEEHDTDEDGGTYWNGEKNAFYCLLEQAYPDELRSTMKAMLNAMAELSSDATAYGCLDDYFCSTQRSIPAVAYNEQARLLYEQAAANWGGAYTASTHPLTQSLGDQLQGEKQWMKLRIIYLSSWAGYGDFSMNGQGSLTFRSATTLAGNAPEYSFDLTPHMWLYPSVTAGSSTSFGKGKSTPQRVKAGDTYTLDGVAADNDTNIQIHGIHYYRSVGQFGDKSLTGDFTVAGDRLVEFDASGVSANGKEFRPSSVAVTATMLRRLNLNGASNVGGTIALADQTRLELADFGSTAIARANIGYPGRISVLTLPSTITALRLVGYTVLEDSRLTLEGVAKISELTISESPLIDSRAILERILGTSGYKLQSVTLYDVDWDEFSTDYLAALGSINNDITGVITYSALNFAQKATLVAAIGDVDDETRKLKIVYPSKSLTGIAIKGVDFVADYDPVQFLITPTPTTGNNFKAIQWSLTSTQYATIDATTGVLTAKEVFSGDDPHSVTIVLTVTLNDNSQLTARKEVALYERECAIGDVVYADATTSAADSIDTTKTIVGTCCYINLANKKERFCMMHSDLGSLPWGSNANATISTGTVGSDLSALPDVTGSTAPTSAAYLNSSNLDGFASQSLTSAGLDYGFMELMSETGDGKEYNYAAGARLPIGRAYTLEIIRVRNKVLGDSTFSGCPLPADSVSKAGMLTALQMCYLQASNKSLWYFLAASYCYSYQPSVNPGETLADCFQQGMWFLPTAGDLARIYYYQAKTTKFDDAKSNANLAALSSTWYWSSTENSYNNAWHLSASNGSVGSYSKNYSYAVRAVVAF